MRPPVPSSPARQQPEGRQHWGDGKQQQAEHERRAKHTQEIGALAAMVWHLSAIRIPIDVITGPGRSGGADCSVFGSCISAARIPFRRLAQRHRGAMSDRITMPEAGCLDVQVRQACQ
jgi:hypothetical protein